VDSSPDVEWHRVEWRPERRGVSPAAGANPAGLPPVGQSAPPIFERTFTLPFPIAPESLRTDWLMGYLLIQAQRLSQDKPRAA